MQAQATLIDGRAVARTVETRVAENVRQLKESEITPGLAVILAGDDPASRVYVNMKKKACDRCGIHSEEITLPTTVSEEDLLTIITGLNKRHDIHGILVQLPLPRHIDSTRIIAAVDPGKDVDGFHPVNLGLLLSGKPSFIPCTPAGVMELLGSAGVAIAGRECVVIGRSLIVGKPMAQLLLGHHGTVTVAHSRTQDLEAVCRRADIVVAAVGVPELVTGKMIKPGAAVIDVGVNRLGEKLVGDVEFDSVSRVASFLTPVPGGVGPMTIAKLMENTVQAALGHTR